MIARSVFAEHGYAGATLDEIANRANLRKPSLLHHFRTKAALYLAIMDDVVERLREFTESVGLENHDSFIDRLDMLGSSMVDYFGANPEAARLLMREMVGGGIYVQGKGHEEIRRTLQVTKAFLEAGMRAGEFRKQDSTQLTLTIVGLHLFYFAAPQVTSPFAGHSVFSPPKLRERKKALLEHVRALCLA